MNVSAVRNSVGKIPTVLFLFGILLPTIFTNHAVVSAQSQQSSGRLSSTGSMIGVTPARTRVYPSRGIQEPKGVLWHTDKLFTMNSTMPVLVSESRGGFTYIGNASNYYTDPIIADDTIYFTFGAKGAFLFIRDVATGKEKKTLKWPSENISVPAIAGNLIYLSGAGGSIFAIDRNDYREKWRIAKPGYWFTETTPVVADGLLYFGGTDSEHSNTQRAKGVIVAIDAANGQGKWVYPLKGIPSSVAYADGMVFFSDQDNHVIAVNAKSGQQVWMYKAPGPTSMPAVMGDGVYFSDQQGHLYAVDKTTGQQRWRSTKVRAVASDLALYNGTIIYSGANRNVTAVDAATGEQKWDFSTTKECNIPVVADGIVYFLSTEKMLHAVDAATGELKWKYKLEHLVFAAPVLANGVVYLLDEQGFMYAIK